MSQQEERKKNIEYANIPSSSSEPLVDLSRLKLLREKRKLTRLMISTGIGMDDSNYGKAEDGKRLFTLAQVRQLAVELNTSMDYLCGLSDDENPHSRPERIKSHTGS